MSFGAEGFMKWQNPNRQNWQIYPGASDEVAEILIKWFEKVFLADSNLATSAYIQQNHGLGYPNNVRMDLEITNMAVQQIQKECGWIYRCKNIEIPPIANCSDSTFVSVERKTPVNCLC